MLPLVALLLAADPDPAKALEERMVRAIAAAERGVAAVVVSHRKYPGEGPPDKPGQLGGYQPHVGRFGRQQPNPGGDRLDLSDPLVAADNTFGSGLVLSADGLILTAYHLIDGATKVYVRTVGGAGSYADLHAADSRSDLAVLKMHDAPPDLRPVRLADVRTAPDPRGVPPTVRRGMWVIALGHPLAAGAVDGQPSASWGILSNLRRKLAGPATADSRTRVLASYPVLLQTDARVTLGCSGGGLFNLDGEAIGLTSAIAGVTGADTAGGYAIPFDVAVRRMVGVLKAGREVEYGFLGVTMDPGGVGRGGVTVTGTTPNMPAGRAGLRGGDRIVRVDDQTVSDSDDLFLHVGAALAGTRVRVGYVRGNRPAEVTVTLAKQERPTGSKFLASVQRPAPFGLRPDWSSVLAITNKLGDGGAPDGVVVRELEPGSPAEEKLKPLGDAVNRWLVTAVDGRPVATPDEFEAATAGRPSVRLTLFDPARPDAPQEVTLP